MLLLIPVVCSNFAPIRFGTHVPFLHCATRIQSNWLIVLLQLYFNLSDVQMLLFPFKNILGHMFRMFAGHFRGSGVVLFCFTLAVNSDSPFCGANKFPAGFGTLVFQINF